MKRALSAFERELAAAMDEYAHSTEPPAFDPGRIAARERRRTRARISLAAVCVATAAGIAACVASGVPGTGHVGNGLPVVGETTAPISTPASASTAASGSGSGLVPTSGATGQSSGAASAAPGSGSASASGGGTVPAWPVATTSRPFAGSVPPVPVLTSIRVGGHPEGGYDRISLEFTGQLPGFRAGYVQSVVRSGSGATVILSGSAVLQLTFSSAQAYDASGNSTLNPNPVNPVSVGLPELRAYVLNGDFEGTVSVALGLTARDGFRVSELTNSPTDHVIYIDIARPR